MFEALDSLRKKYDQLTRPSRRLELRPGHSLDLARWPMDKNFSLALVDDDLSQGLALGLRREQFVGGSQFEVTIPQLLTRKFDIFVGSPWLFAEENQKFLMGLWSKTVPPAIVTSTEISNKATTQPEQYIFQHDKEQYGIVVESGYPVSSIPETAGLMRIPTCSKDVRLILNSLALSMTWIEFQSKSAVEASLVLSLWGAQNTISCQEVLTQELADFRLSQALSNSDTVGVRVHGLT